MSSPTTYPTRTFASHRPSCHRPPPVFIPELACSLLPPSLSNNRQLVDQLCSWSRRRFLRAPNSFPHPGLTPTGEPWATPTTCADEQHPTTASRPPAPTGRHPGPPSRPHPPTHRTLTCKGPWDTHPHPRRETHGLRGQGSPHAAYQRLRAVCWFEHRSGRCHLVHDLNRPNQDSPHQEPPLDGHHPTWLGRKIRAAALLPILGRLRRLTVWVGLPLR